ncbi:MAG: serine/threonine protein kinase [Myxococcales bacterium]|nr:serine/threonine protein kinase [Myxococcales bacterium]
MVWPAQAEVSDNATVPVARDAGPAQAAPLDSPGRHSHTALVAEPSPTGVRHLCEVCGGAYPETFRVCPVDATPLRPEGETRVDPLLGTVLASTYRITRVLATGGMGRLYEAAHVRLPRRVAIKVIHEQYARYPALIERFEREARASSAIESPHVLGVLDLLQVPDGRPCMVSDLLDGEDLSQRLEREGELEPAEAIRIGIEMAHGLAAAHAIGIVHRDLKPSNVFLCRSGAGGLVPLDDVEADGGEDGTPRTTSATAPASVRLLDFGVAKLDGAESLTVTGAVVGTPSYMAPEQALGRDVDGRADVYGVGAVLYRALTGRPPYTNGKASAVLERIAHRDPPPPRSIRPSVPVALEAIIQRAMARDPALRFESAEALAAALSELRADTHCPTCAPDPTAGRPSLAARALARQARMARPSAIAVGAALSLTVACATALSLYVAAGAASPASVADRGLGPLMVGLTILSAVSAAAAWLSGVRERWRSATALEAFVRRAARTLAGGLGAYGLALGVFAARSVLLNEPFDTALAIRLAPLGLAFAGAAWIIDRWNAADRRQPSSHGLSPTAASPPPPPRPSAPSPAPPVPRRARASVSPSHAPPNVRRRRRASSGG